MAHVTSKRLLLTGIFALSSAFVLASCDNVTAMPANYETPIINKGDVAFDDDANKLGEIYDALASNKNEKVVSALLEKIAEKEFGTYKELKECFSKNEKGEYVLDETKGKAHIEAYAHEFKQDDDAKVAEKKGTTELAVQLSRLQYFFEDLNDRINKVIFDEISSDTYRDTINKTEFLEEKYARAKREDNYDIKGFDDDGKATIDFKEVFVDSDFIEENVRNYLTDFEETYEDYITKKIIADVYKDKLVEEYIIDNNYSALGRAYGREVNYVKISYSSEDPNTAYRLATLFTEKYLDNDSAKGKDISYTALVNWIKGFEGVGTHVVDTVTYPVIKPLSTEYETDLDKIYGEKVKFEGVCEKTGEVYDASKGLENYGFSSSFTYYEKTKLGEILKNYQKAVVGEATRFASSDDVAQYDAFTSNGKQSKEQGLMQQITDLALDKSNNFEDSGWFVKNDSEGKLSLPDEIKNRLFNIKVSNDFGKEGWEYVKDESYFKEVKGHYYLTPASASDAKYNFVLRDTSGSALYVVEILEAPSTSKLNKDSDKSYLNDPAAEGFKTEAIARQIAKLLGTKDTYTTNAYTSYLKLYTFVYHDTSVYDYLKETYPNLFEEE